jgi:hypothetical protein
MPLKRTKDKNPGFESRSHSVTRLASSSRLGKFFVDATAVSSFSLIPSASMGLLMAQGRYWSAACQIYTNGDYHDAEPICSVWPFSNQRYGEQG